MFKIPIKGVVNGKEINVYLHKRYKITVPIRSYEGTLTKCDEISEMFLIKTIEGGFWIKFKDIDNIEELNI